MSARRRPGRARRAALHAVACVVFLAVGAALAEAARAGDAVVVVEVSESISAHDGAAPAPAALVDAPSTLTLTSAVGISFVTQGTTTSLAVPAQATRLGVPAALTASVAAAGFPVTIGLVQFADGATPLGPPVFLDAAGHASVTSTELALGNHALTATYLGALGFAKSSASAAHGVYDYAVAVAPGDATVLRGAHASYDATVTLASASTQTGLPGALPVETTGGVSADLPASLELPQIGGASFRTPFAVATPDVGDFAFAVAVGGVSAPAALHVYDYVLSAPSDLTVLRGDAAHVTLGAAFVPGSTAVGVPDSLRVGDLVLALPGSLDLDVATAELGDRELTWTTGDRTASTSLHVWDYELALAPRSVLVQRGERAAFTLSASAVDGSSLVGVPERVAVEGSLPSTLPATVALGAPAPFDVDATTPGPATLTVTGTPGARTATAELFVNAPPVVETGGPYVVAEGGSVDLHGSATDGDGDALTFDWGLGAPGADATFSAAALDGPATVPVTLTACDDHEACVRAATTVTVENAAPAASLAAPNGADEGAAFAVSLDGGTDAGAADRAAGLRYAFACDGTSFTTASPAHDATCTFDDGPSAHTVRARVLDKDGAFTEYAHDVAVRNVAPAATLTAPPGPLAEGSTFAVSLDGASDASPADAAALTYAFDCGGGYGAPTATPAATCAAVDDPRVSIRARVLDKDGGASEYAAAVPVTNVAPSVSISSPGRDAVVVAGTIVPLAGAFGDPGAADAHSAAWTVGATTLPAVVTGSAVAGSYFFTSAGIVPIGLTVADDDGGSGSATTSLVVYDPSAGFVTGGGWIAADGGKITFAVNAKYLTGATTPTGSVTVHGGGVDFESTSLRFLVVTGTTAIVEGPGFRATAVDGSPNEFAIRVWDASGRTLADTGAPRPLGGGQIQIHRR